MYSTLLASQCKHDEAPPDRCMSRAPTPHRGFFCLPACVLPYPSDCLLPRADWYNMCASCVHATEPHKMIPGRHPCGIVLEALGALAPAPGRRHCSSTRALLFVAPLDSLTRASVARVTALCPGLQVLVWGPQRWACIWTCTSALHYLQDCKEGVAANRGFKLGGFGFGIIRMRGWWRSAVAGCGGLVCRTLGQQLMGKKGVVQVMPSHHAWSSRPNPSSSHHHSLARTHTRLTPTPQHTTSIKATSTSSCKQGASGQGKVKPNRSECCGLACSAPRAYYQTAP